MSRFKQYMEFNEEHEKRMPDSLKDKKIPMDKLTKKDVSKKWKNEKDVKDFIEKTLKAEKFSDEEIEFSRKKLFSVVAIANLRKDLI